VTWTTTDDVHAFLAAAAEFLAARPVEHTVLLTESAYLAARPQPASYGWFHAEGEVAGAFVRAPRHPAVLSLMPGPAALSLVDTLDDGTVDVDARLVPPLLAAGMTERSRITLYRLGTLTRPVAAGQARTATAADRNLLLDWYGRLMAANPDDPTDLAYLVDEPLSYGGATLWEVDGVPVAVAGRSRLVAGMVRVGAVYAPDGRGEQAVLAAACAAAQASARDVLVFGARGDTSMARLGFEPALERVVLRR
jgi:hypothetical protein